MSATREEDFFDTYRAVGADPTDEKSTVGKSAITEFMQAHFELDVDLDKVFDSVPPGPALNYDDFKKILVPNEA